MMRFDVAVIGGGPAGCAAAIAAGQAGAAVALIDRAPPESSARIGELLEPDGVALLAALTGASTPPPEATSVYSIGSAWDSATIQYRDFMSHPAGASLVVDRPRLMDALHGRMAQFDITRFTGIGTVERQGPHDWQCTVRTGGAIRTAMANAIVLATGRGGCAMRPRVSLRRTDQLFALVRLFRIKRSEHSAGMALLEAAPSSWWFGVPVTDDIYAASCFSDSDIAGTFAGGRDAFFASALQTTTHLRSLLAEASPIGSIRAMDASTCFCATHVGPDWISAGDNALAFDPLTGFGLKKALLEGLAAGAFAAESRGAGDMMTALQARHETDQSDYLRQRHDLYAAAGARFGTGFWRRRMDDDHARH